MPPEEVQGLSNFLLALGVELYTMEPRVRPLLYSSEAYNSSYALIKPRCLQRWGAGVTWECF